MRPLVAAPASPICAPSGFYPRYGPRRNIHSLHDALLFRARPPRWLAGAPRVSVVVSCRARSPREICMYRRNAYVVYLILETAISVAGGLYGTISAVYRVEAAGLNPLEL